MRPWLDHHSFSNNLEIWWGCLKADIWVVDLAFTVKLKGLKDIFKEVFGNVSCQKREAINNL